MIKKDCIKCSINKPLTEYYKHHGMRDGTLNKCKSYNIQWVTKSFNSFKRDK